MTAHLSIVPEPTRSGQPPATDANADEAAHLRRFIETQPFCLMRVGIDGGVLAANEAALGLLGARDLSQVLGSNVIKWMVSGAEDHWRQFSARVAIGAASSFECQLTDLTGTPRTVLLQGVPLLEHPDGVPSMILGARDISTSLRIEDALRIGNPDKLPPAPQGDAKEIAAQHAKLEALERLLKEGRTHLQGLRTQLQQAISERDQLAAKAVQDASKPEVEQQVIALQARLETASSEQRQLAADLELATSAHRQEIAELQAEHARLRQAREEQYEHDLASSKHEIEQQMTELRAQLEMASAGQRRLAADLEAAETTYQQRLAEQQTAHARAENALLDQHELDLLFKDQEAQQRVTALQSQLDSAVAERDRLTGLLQETEVVHHRFVSEISAERAAHEAVLQTVALTQKQLEKEAADYQLEIRNMDACLRQLIPLVASGRVALEVGREWGILAETIDARAAALLTQSSLDAGSRSEIEALRRDALQAKLLAAQIPQARTDSENPKEEQA